MIDKLRAPGAPILRAVGAAALALALAACTTPTVYGPAGPDGEGYREQRIESDRYIVSFAGNSATNPDAVADAALRRAADVTLTQGYDWFEVVNRTSSIEAARSGGSGVSVGVGGVSGSRGSSVGTSVGLSFPLGGGSSGESITSLEVRMGSGERPEGANVYDARSVSQNLASTLAGP